MNLEEIKSKIYSNKISMLPVPCMDNIKYCIDECIKNNIEGDYIECGIWRGGALLYAQKVFESYNDYRPIWGADSFQGIMKPNPQKYPADTGDMHWADPQLSVSLEQVKNNFRLFGDIPNNVNFLEGWFKDTLSDSRIERISILRADGDLYESTIDILNNLYHKLSVGGFCIIDDFGHKGAKAAVMDFREKHGITDEIKIVHTQWTDVTAFWHKTK